MNRGQLIILSGPSGCGKGTVLNSLLSQHKDICLSISATTRSPREGEKDGIHYFFKTTADFEKLIAEDGVLEYAQYCGNYYGTPKAFVEENLQKGISVILEIETQGALQVMKKCPDAVSIFILPPSFEELRRRLTDRHTETAQVVEKRLSTAQKEIQLACHYQYAVVNDEVEKACEKIYAIIQAESCKTAHMREFINEVL